MPISLFIWLALPSRMSDPDRKEVAFQATAVDNNRHHYAIQKGPDGLFCVWKGATIRVRAHNRCPDLMSSRSQLMS